MRTTRTAPTRLALALLAALAGAPGCAYFAPKPTLMPGTPEVGADLPVPQGFELARDRTWRHERSAYRRLRLTYTREDYLSKERVVEFIRTHYPKHGWEVKFVYGLETPKLILHKGGEECRITVTEDFGDAVTEFVVEVEPRLTPDGALVANEVAVEATAPIPILPETQIETNSVPASAPKPPVEPTTTE